MRRCTAALVLLAAMPVVAHAGEARSSLAVSAHVPSKVTLETLSQPAQLTVSEADIARGHVDLAAVYRVTSNDPAGYVVRLAPRVGLTQAVEVSGLASRVVMAEEVVEVSQPAALRPQQLNLGFRLLLDGSAVPGTYEVPVLVAVRAL